ncbi:hypothetical protein [Baaleninema sp.]|uniref:hypothetical protein n=1 Tax=Baaleninema sp. TaxID=3101197 RepID=UPI003CFC08C9
MLTVVSPEQLYLSPGTVLRSPGTWADYVSLLKQRGDLQNTSTNKVKKIFRSRCLRGNFPYN